MAKGYHVQVTARSERDLTPEGIVQKVSDASGSKYSASIPSGASDSRPPPISSKPAFTPTRSSRGVGGFNPLADSRSRLSASKDADVDEDGWGQDAPQVTRTQLEKVQSSYRPTKVDMRELSSQKPEPSNFSGGHNDDGAKDSDIVKGTYQPIGKVDIAVLRRQAQEAGKTNDDRPNVVKGSYEPVGKVDIAEIRARAQKPGEKTDLNSGNVFSSTSSVPRSSDRDQDRATIPNRSAPFSTSERLTALPKPKVGNRFGSGTTNFTGTKAPTPGGYDSGSSKGPAAPLGIGRTFADQSGKTPAQLWAEKKGRERGISETGDNQPSSNFKESSSPVTSQKSGGGEWKSGYGGKSWAPVQTTRTGQSQGSLSRQITGDDVQEDAAPSPASGIGAIRDRFKDAPTMGMGSANDNNRAPSPPPLDTSSKPNAGRGVPLPGLPTRQLQSASDEREDDDDEQEISRMPTPPRQPPRSPTPPTPPPDNSMSPIRVAMPVSRGHEIEIENAAPPPVMPTRSLAQAIPHEDDLTDEPIGHDPARGAAEAVAASTFGDDAKHLADKEGGRRALVQYDYEKAESNELELKEGEYVTNIDMVDDDWWMGQNMHGETGLFPSNYVELVEEEDRLPKAILHESHDESAKLPEASKDSQGPTATALYEYEAAEENELSFPEDAKITDVVSTLLSTYISMAKYHKKEFPDEDWWSGHFGGKHGLFPANYVRLDE